MVGGVVGRTLLFVCLAARVLEFSGGLPEMSNIYCHPGKPEDLLLLFSMRSSRRMSPARSSSTKTSTGPVATIASCAEPAVEAFAGLA